MQSYNLDENSGNAAAGLLGILSILIVPIIVITIIGIIAHWKIYTKAGKPGWACIVPIYNIIVLLEIVGKPIWWIFLFFIPCVNFVFIIWTINLLSKSFGQGVGFTLGLLLLGVIFYPLLAFGNYPYLGPAGAEGGLRPIDPFAPIDYKGPFGPPPQA